MKKIILVVLTVLISATFATSIIAQDKDFKTTKEEILKALTKVPVGTRSLEPSRAIAVVEKKNGRTVEKTVTEDTAAPRVNLKIEFDYNSYAIRTGSFRLLNELGNALTSDELRGKQIMIKGHTDSDGSDAYNLTLSLNRALSVKNYLLGNFSIESERLRAVGYGEVAPLVANTSRENKQMNRRVEVQVDPGPY